MHFDGTVTLGNILVIATFAAAAINYGIRIGADLKALKEWVRGHEVCSKKHMDILNELRGELQYLRGSADGSRHNRRITDSDFLEGRD